MELIDLKQIKTVEDLVKSSQQSKLEYLIKHITKDTDCYLATRYITYENKNNS